MSEVEFATGKLSAKVVEGILNALPMELTFVDEAGDFRYFSQAREQIFKRSTKALGRNVQQCHPAKSLPWVNEIIGDLRSGKRQSVEIAIELEGRRVLIRYYPVRDAEGNYLGCLETVQQAEAASGE